MSEQFHEAEALRQAALAKVRAGSFEDALVLYDDARALAQRDDGDNCREQNDHGHADEWNGYALLHESSEVSVPEKIACGARLSISFLAIG